MKNIVLALAVAVLFVGCSGNKKENKPLSAKEQTKAIAQAVQKYNSCKYTSDCQPVFADCCTVAKEPYFVNKKHAKAFTADYKAITGQGDCSKPVACTKTYYGVIFTIASSMRSSV